MRDDFTAKTKDLLAKRVGFRCSICDRPTSGPGSTPEGIINLGVAAHISAASPGGPRYDDTLTKDDRISIENGIWLCQNCAHLIDSDEKNFTIEFLKKKNKEPRK